MADTDPSEWVLIDTDLTTRLAILPVINSHIYMEFSEPGSGEIRIPLDCAAAALIESGQYCELTYRGSVISGFFVENIKKVEADGSENGGRYLSASGRGPLAILDDAIIWGDGTTATTREFTNVTKASILIDLIEEAQARGGLSALTWTFTDTDDSDSVPWTDSESYKLSVGMSLLDLMRQFTRTGVYFDIYRSGNQFALYAFNDLSQDRTSLYFRTGINCEEVTRDERGDEIKNATLVKYRDGYVSVTDSTSITNRRRRENMLNIEAAQTSESALTFASAKLATNKDPQSSISIRVYDGISPRAFVDYWSYATVTLDINGTQTTPKILGLQADFDGNDFAHIVLEFGSIMRERELKFDDELTTLENRWNTARDASLTEVINWTGIWTFGIDVVPQSMMILSGYLYVACTGSGDINAVVRYNLVTRSWEYALGGTVPQYATDIIAVGTDIYVAGKTTTGGVDKIFLYSSGSWSVVGTMGVGDTINALATDGTNLYIGTSVQAVVDALTLYDAVGRWNGSAWSSLSAGSAGQTWECKALAVMGGSVYGGFSIGARKWTGTAWTAAPVNAIVTAMAVSGSDIVVAIANKVVLWDGASSWTEIGTLNASYTVLTIKVNLSDIYIGGTFTAVNTTGYFRVAKYSGGTWTMLENGVGSNVYALEYSDGLFVGGLFTTAGGKDITNLAIRFTTFQDLVDHLAGAANSSFDMGAAIHNAPASAVSDSDEFPFWEDAAQALRKITWANIKATLKTYFDTLYAAVAKGVTNGDSHDHNGGDGAAIVEAAITLADNTTNDVSITKHGFVPKAPNDTAKFLRGDGTWATGGGSYTDEQAQDAIGAMIDATLTYVDATPALGISQTVLDGWLPRSETWTRTGNHTFTVSGDVTATYRKGAYVKYKDGGSYEYGVVISSSYSNPNTTINLLVNSDYAMAAATITDKYISYIPNPEGFPTWFNVTHTYTGFSADPTAISRVRIIGTELLWTWYAYTNGTSNATTFGISLPVTAATITNMIWDSPASAVDNGAAGPLGHCYCISAGTSLVMARSQDAAWTNSGGKGGSFTKSYEI